MSKFYSPIINDGSSIQYQLKHLKILQESKRIRLDIYLRTYTLKIQQYDQYYQYELIKFKRCLNTSINHLDVTTLLLSVQAYVSSRNKQEIYLRMNYLHMQLTHRHQCSSTSKQMIGVSPEVFPGVHHRQHHLNAIELGSYIRLNRATLLPHSERIKLVQEEHDKITKKIKQSLSKSCQSTPLTSPLFKQFSQRLRACLIIRYMTPLSYTDQIRAKQEREIVKSIRKKSKKNKLILRESDKIGNLYIGLQSAFEQKATYHI